MTRRMNRLPRTAACAMLTAAVLAGCASTSADLRPDTAAKLQDRLQSLARSAADNDLPTARTELDLLADDVATAAANGELSAGRRQDIQNAINLIRADLAAPGTPAPAPSLQTPAPATPQQPAKGKGNGRTENQNTDD